MKIKQLECFCALAETLNFSKAASLVYITQPAFSKTIASLEKELNCSLFTRSKTAPALTEAGLQIFPIAKKIVSEANEIEQIALLSQEESTQILNFGCFWGGLHKQERTTIRQYFRDRKVSLNFNEYSEYDLFQALDLGIIDFGIFIGHYHPILENYFYIPMQANPTCFICSSDHPLAQEKSLQVSQLAQEPFIVLKKEKTFSDKEYLTNLCYNHGFTPQINAYSDAVFTLLDCVEQGIGTTILGSDVLAISRHDVVAVPLEDVPPSYHYLLIRTNDNRPAVQDFFQYVKAHISPTL